MGKVYGKYRAVVVNIVDPENRGRIKVVCPELFGDSVSNWCLSHNHIHNVVSESFSLPEIAEVVWIEFERGDINRPIYTWSSASPEGTSNFYVQEETV